MWNLIVKENKKFKTDLITSFILLLTINPYIKLGLKNREFNDAKIEEYEFHHYKSPISIDDIDINEISVSDKISFGK